MPLYDEAGQLAGVVVAERSLTEVTTAVRLVRNALIAAAGIGLAVAIALGLALSSTLTRRLGRLQRAALRITAEGPEAPPPIDRGQRRGRRPGARDRPHAGGAQTPGGGAAIVRVHRLARAAHAADDAPGHDGAARGGPARRHAPRGRAGAGRRTPGASCGGSRCWRASCSTSQPARRRRAAALGAGRADRDHPRRRRGVLAARGRARRAAGGRRERGPVLGARRPGGLRARRAHPDRQRAALRARRAADPGQRRAR